MHGFFINFGGYSVNLQIDEKEYELQYYASSNIVGAEIINEGMDIARRVLETEPFREYLNSSGIFFDGIFTYESDSINAIAYKEGGTCIVAISNGLFVHLYKWFQMWKCHPKVKDIFSLKNEEEINLFFENSYLFAIFFVTAHELYHLLNGHCCVNKTRTSMSEKKVNEEKTQNLFCQVLEMDADICATFYCTNIVWNISGPLEQKLRTSHCLLFAIYNVFILFNEKDFDTLMSEDFADYDHPHPSIRLAYCFASILAQEAAYVDMEILKNDLYFASSECMEFDRVLLEHNKLKECLSTLAYTEAGVNHINCLSKKWKKVEKMLRKHAYIGLRTDYNEISIKPWVTENGEFDLNNILKRA